nr:hypothetical protein [Tanacetum cinerariifolium]
MALHLILLEVLDDVADLNFLRDQTYVLFQREVLEEEEWGMVLHGRYLERLRWSIRVIIWDGGEMTWKRGGVMMVMV